MVLVEAQHNLSKPGTDPPDDEGSGGELPAEVGETQKREGLRLSLSALFPVSSACRPESLNELGILLGWPAGRNRSMGRRFPRQVSTFCPLVA